MCVCVCVILTPSGSSERPYTDLYFYLLKGEQLGMQWPNVQVFLELLIFPYCTAKFHYFMICGCCHKITHIKLLFICHRK